MFFLILYNNSYGDFMGNLIVISGPSGVGKGTIIKEIKERYQDNDKNLYVSVSYTTRKIREGERDGVDYHFVSVQEFENLIKNNGLLEYNEYGTGNYYGTPKDLVFNYLDNDYDVILEIDVNGYQKIKELNIPHESIFIAPPSYDVLENRLKRRNTESNEIIQKRLKAALNEINHMDIYDYVIYNKENELEQAVDDIMNIMNKKYSK